MHFRSILCLISCAGSLHAATPISVPLMPGEPTANDLTRAKNLLESWQSQSPANATRVMRIVYWTPADRDPQPDYLARLTRVMKHVQAFYRTQLDGYGFPDHTIRLDLKPDGMLNLLVAKGTLKSAECSETDQRIGQTIRRDCLQALKATGIDGNKETMVIFCNLADWDPEKRTMSHHSPYYASGTHASGTAWQLDSPLLDSGLLEIKDQFLTDRQYGHISLGKYNSIFVGGVCHELGHALGMPHCRECPSARPLRGTALMGSGNRTYGQELRNEGKGTFLTVGHALKLAAHPQFSGSVKQIETPARVTFSDWQLSPSAEGLKVSGKVSSNLPCHAVIAYGDPEGGGDYDSAISAAVPQADGSFSLILPNPDARNRPALLSFVGVCVNGAATAGVWSSQAFSVPCRIDDHGGYEVTATLATLELQRILPDLQSHQLTTEASQTLTPLTREIVRRLNQPEQRQRTIAATAPAEVKSLALSDAQPQSAATGYGGVHFDRSPEGMPLIGALGPVAHGLWAHAESEFSYDLAGQWSQFTTSAALLTSGDGPVRATIIVDGKTAWDSGVMERNAIKSTTISVQGATTLTLRIHGVKGIRSAHGAWLQPTLSR